SEKVRACRAACGSGPRHVVVRRGLVYLLNELGNTLVVLRPDEDGTLAELPTGADAATGLRGIQPHRSPRGQRGRPVRVRLQPWPRLDHGRRPGRREDW